MESFRRRLAYLIWRITNEIFYTKWRLNDSTAHGKLGHEEALRLDAVWDVGGMGAYGAPLAKSRFRPPGTFIDWDQRIFHYCKSLLKILPAYGPDNVSAGGGNRARRYGGRASVSRASGRRASLDLGVGKATAKFVIDFEAEARARWVEELVRYSRASVCRVNTICP